MNRKHITTAAYYMTFIVLGSIVAAEGPTLPKLAEHTSSRLDQVSLIFFFGSLGYLLSSYFSGRLYDRISGHRLMTVALIALGLVAALVPIASALWALVLIVLVLGLAKGTLDVGGNALLLWVHNEKVGPFMNGLHAFYGIGAFLSPLVAARVIAGTGDIHWVYWSFAIATLPVALFIWNLPSPQPRATPEKHKNSAFPILPVIIMALCFTLYVGGEAGYGSWIYTYALTLGLETNVTAAYVTSAFWGFFTIGRVLGIWVSTLARPKTILFLDFAGCLASLGLILLFRESKTILWIGSILFGVSQASIFPTLLTLAEERMHVTGAITGWFLVGSSLGAMILPWSIGQAFVRLGAGSMMTIIFFDMLLCVLILWLFTRITVHTK